MGGEAFGSAMACFPSVGECQGTEVEEGGWEREHLHGSNGRGDGSGGKVITSEM